MGDRITFFTYDTKKYEQAVRPIADEAIERGYEVIFSDEPYVNTDIAVYTTAVQPYHPSASADLSAFIFHGLDSAYSRGPIRYDWSRFDVGLLAGPKAGEAWQGFATNPKARPRIGAYTVGWPKSDKAFSPEFDAAVTEYAEELHLEHDKTFLYAPTFECDRNMERFIEAVDAESTNILIKHGDYDDGRALEDISLESLYETYWDEPEVTILDRDDDIFYPLGVADVVVSDSDSVLLESLLTDTVPMTVTDWEKRNGSLRGESDIPEFVQAVSEAELETLSSKRLDEIVEGRRTVEAYRNDHFAHQGNSAAITMDLLEALYSGSKPPLEPLEPLDQGSRLPRYKNGIRDRSLYALSHLLVCLPASQRDWILNNDIHRKISSLVNR